MPAKQEGRYFMSQVETQIKIKLPDGAERQLDKGQTGADLAKNISEGLYRKAVGVMINEELRDLSPLSTTATP
jgi:threonyl-tRNA synthetase